MLRVSLARLAIWFMLFATLRSRKISSFAKAQYIAITGRRQRREDDVLLYQIRQSFRPGEITPEEANRISYELAMSFTKGRHAFLVCTHEDKEHFHSHAKRLKQPGGAKRPGCSGFGRQPGKHNEAVSPSGK